MTRFPIEVPLDEIKKFCEKWKVKEFALFGSILRSDFDPEASDIDVLVSFLDGAHFSLFQFVDMKEELVVIFKRKVDLVTKRGIEEASNPIRKNEILKTYEVIYAQAA